MGYSADWGTKGWVGRNLNVARCRNIKPGYFKNELLAQLPAITRILFAGLWCLADREGRLEDRPVRIKAEILPYDDCDVDKALDTLASGNDPFILRYKAEDRSYIQIVKWHEHQKPHHMETISVIPAGPGMTTRYNDRGVNKDQRQRILQRDGHKCVHCGAQDNLQVDHIIPLSKGGRSTDDNLQTLCKTCNLRKGDSEHFEQGPSKALANIEVKVRGSEVDGLEVPKKSKRHTNQISAASVPVPPEFEIPEVRAAIADWLDFKVKRGEPYKDPGYLGRKIAEFTRAGPAAFVAAVNSSIGNNYAGIFPRKDINGKQQPTRTGAGQRYRGQ